MKRQRVCSRQGSLMPLVFGMMMTVMMLAMGLFEFAQAALLERKAEAIAFALASEIQQVATLAHAEYGAQAAMSGRLDLMRLAAANGFDERNFYPIAAADVERGRDWTRVTVRARHRAASPRSSTVRIVRRDACAEATPVDAVDANQSLTEPMSGLE